MRLDLSTRQQLYHRTMGQDLALLPDAPEAAHIADGRAMASLNPQRRMFVREMLKLGPTPKAATFAAAKAGYNPLYGYDLMREEAIIAALREEATKKLAGAALLGVSVMIEIAQDPMHKDRYKAAKDLAAINGFTAEQKIVVEHIDSDGKAMIQKIRTMAADLGMDAQQLIAAAGIIDAEYSVVEDVQVDDSDW